MLLFIKYAFSIVKQYIWVLNTQIRDYHSKVFNILPYALGGGGGIIYTVSQDEWPSLGSLKGGLKMLKSSLKTVFKPPLSYLWVSMLLKGCLKMA